MRITLFCLARTLGLYLVKIELYSKNLKYLDKVEQCAPSGLAVDVGNILNLSKT